MTVWTSFKSRTAPAQAWLRRRWAPAAAITAALAATVGFIADLDSLVMGGGPLTQAEASALAANVASHLESSSVARGGDYRGNTDLEQTVGALARSGDRRVEQALADLDDGNSGAAFDALEDSARRLERRTPEAAAERWFALGVVAEAIDPQRAISAYEASLGLRPDESRTLDRLGGVYLEQGQDARAEQLVRRALEIARETGDEPEESIVLGSLGSIYWMRGDYETARGWYEQALQLADLNGDLFRAARHLGNMGLMAEADRDDAAAEQYYERALSLMQEMDDTVGIALAQNNLGGIYRQRGEFDRAEDAYRRAQATFEAEGHPQRTALTLSNLGSIAEARGDFETASRFYERSLERAREYQYVRAIERAARNAGWMALRRGDYAAARTYADEALEAAALTPDPAGEADALILSIGISAASQDSERAYAHAERVFAIIENREVAPDTRAYVHDALALAAYHAGDFDDAARQAGLALPLYEEAGLIASVAEQQLRLGSLALQRGDHAAGCDWLAAAEVSYGRSGFIAQANRMVERRESENCPAREIGNGGDLPADAVEPG